MRRRRGQVFRVLDLQIRGPKLKSRLACVQTCPLPQKKIGRRGRGDVCTQAKSRSDL